MKSHPTVTLCFSLPLLYYTRFHVRVNEMHPPVNDVRHPVTLWGLRSTSRPLPLTVDISIRLLYTHTHTKIYPSTGRIAVCAFLRWGSSTTTRQPPRPRASKLTGFEVFTTADATTI